MLNTGFFPDKLKIAKVIPIHKKDDETFFTNYRPISLLPALSKIFEKAIYNQLYEYFQEYKLFYNSQYGFRAGHSTEYAAIELVDKIITEMDKDKLPICFFLDLSKAFDTLDHRILLDKLNYYGIKDTPAKLFESYLTNRFQYVEMNETKSELLPIMTGVPQGSILGPVLFIIYINDISEVSKTFEFIMYADDSTLTSTLNSFLSDNTDPSPDVLINRELIKITEWLNSNKLSLNVQKTKFTIFHQPNKKVRIPNITINSIPVEHVNTFNFLGITLDQQLNWNAHIDKLANKLSKGLGILNKLKHILPMSAKLKIYHSIVLSHINYGILVGGFKLDKIEKIQKKIIRVLTCSQYNAHTDPLYKNLNLLKVKDIFTISKLKFYHNYVNNKLPTNLLKFPLQLNIDRQTYNTRRAQNLFILRHKHTFAKNCLRYDMASTLNNTSGNIKEKVYTHSLNGMANYAKIMLLDKYQDTCTIQNCYICTRAHH